ncbi:lysozyme [Lacrimispora xylanisolvens]|uniref:lysozyme n=1 Tax=Lacrimispora xylanisolvens TaxID=384636 RepID=UPI002402B8F3
MNVSTTGKNFIKSFEKYRLDVYDDGFGFLTVGYGHKVVATDNLKEGDIITASRATTLFNADILTVETGINKHPKVSKFTQAQYDAVASLTFNAGTEYITNSKNDLYKALNKSIFVKSEVVKGFTVTIAGGIKTIGLSKAT